jgi:6-pyruvoyltetrahydropterin/6-carboxytetrahydropterin synthase
MVEQFWVRLSKENLVFSAAHFITYAGNICERLHGHNYQVAVCVQGPLDENQYVVDFIALRDTLQSLIAELDHRMLLPSQHPQIRVTAFDTEVLVTFEDRRWVFPRGDCVVLPLANTTAELLARYLGQRLAAALSARTPGLERIRVVVDENRGQWGCWETTLTPEPAESLQSPQNSRR